MSATLLTFARRQPGWDNEERALIARLERLLMGAGIAVELELGETDEGDPWAAFCNAFTGDVVVHLARLDGYYLVEAGVLGRAIEGRSLAQCAERFFAEAVLVAPERRQGAGLYLHPSAMLAGMLLSIMLYAQMYAPRLETELEEVGADGATIDIDALIAAAEAVAEESAEDAAEASDARTAGDDAAAAEEIAEAATAAAEAAAKLRQIVQSVGQFIAAEASRDGGRDRASEAGQPFQAWVMLHSAAMVVAFGIAEESQLRGALGALEGEGALAGILPGDALAGTAFAIDGITGEAHGAASAAPAGDNAENNADAAAASRDGLMLTDGDPFGFAFAPLEDLLAFAPAGAAADVLAGRALAGWRDGDGQDWSAAWERDGDIAGDITAGLASAFGGLASLDLFAFGSVPGTERGRADGAPGGAEAESGAMLAANTLPDAFPALPATRGDAGGSASGSALPFALRDLVAERSVETSGPAVLQIAGIEIVDTPLDTPVTVLLPNFEMRAPVEYGLLRREAPDALTALDQFAFRAPDRADALLPGDTAAPLHYAIARDPFFALLRDAESRGGTADPSRLETRLIDGDVVLIDPRSEGRTTGELVTLSLDYADNSSTILVTALETLDDWLV